MPTFIIYSTNAENYQEKNKIYVSRVENNQKGTIVQGMTALCRELCFYIFNELFEKISINQYTLYLK